MMIANKFNEFDGEKVKEIEKTRVLALNGQKIFSNVIKLDLQAPPGHLYLINPKYMITDIGEK